MEDALAMMELSAEVTAGLAAAALPLNERPTRPGWWLWWDGRRYQHMQVIDGRQATTDREHLCARKITDTYTVPWCGYPVNHFWRGGWWAGPFESETALIAATPGNGELEWQDWHSWCQRCSGIRLPEPAREARVSFALSGWFGDMETAAGTGSRAVIVWPEEYAPALRQEARDAVDAMNRVVNALRRMSPNAKSSDLRP